MAMDEQTELALSRISRRVDGIKEALVWIALGLGVIGGLLLRHIYFSN